MRHRALDYSPDTPVRELGLAALDELIGRGDLDDWQPLLDELRHEPHGPVAARVGRLLESRSDDGATAIWRAFLDEARREASPSIGPALRALRERHGLTQAEVGRLLGATQPEISKLERRADTRVSTVRAYVGALGGRLRLVAQFDDGESDVGAGT